MRRSTRTGYPGPNTGPFLGCSAAGGTAMTGPSQSEHASSKRKQPALTSSSKPIASSSCLAPVWATNCTRAGGTGGYRVKSDREQKRYAISTGDVSLLASCNRSLPWMRCVSCGISHPPPRGYSARSSMPCGSRATAPADLERTDSPAQPPSYEDNPAHQAAS